MVLEFKLFLVLNNGKLSLSHSISSGASPLITVHKTLYRCPSCRVLGKMNSSITGRTENEKFIKL